MTTVMLEDPGPYVEVLCEAVNLIATGMAKMAQEPETEKHLEQADEFALEVAVVSCLQNGVTADEIIRRVRAAAERN